MKRTKLVYFIVALVFFSSLAFAQEESITFTTYYPSPYGSYNQLQTNSFGVGDNNGNGVLDAGDSPPTTTPPYGDVWIAGKVGIGTTNPEENLHIVESGQAFPVVYVDGYGVRRDGNVYAPHFIGRAARGTQIAPSGILKDDVISVFRGIGYGLGGWVGTNDGAAEMQVIADGNFTSTSAPGRLVFTTTPINNTLGIQRMVIDSAGNVGIGTTSPTRKLEIHGNKDCLGGDVCDNVFLDGNPGVGGDFEYTGGSDNLFGFFHRGAGTGKTGFVYWSADKTVLRELMTIQNNGNVGIGVGNPTRPLEMGSGAYCSAAGLWTNASSRAYKQDIAPLALDKALKALMGLNPVTFRSKRAPDERHVGFISEDVPELVATKDRTGLSSMDIVAVLTKVVQQQQKEIEELRGEVRVLRGVK